MQTSNAPAVDGGQRPAQWRESVWVARGWWRRPREIGTRTAGSRGASEVDGSETELVGRLDRMSGIYS